MAKFGNSRVIARGAYTSTEMFRKGIHLTQGVWTAISVILFIYGFTETTALAKKAHQIPEEILSTTRTILRRISSEDQNITVSTISNNYDEKSRLSTTPQDQIERTTVTKTPLKETSSEQISTIATIDVRNFGTRHTIPNVKKNEVSETTPLQFENISFSIVKEKPEKYQQIKQPNLEIVEEVSKPDNEKVDEVTSKEFQEDIEEDDKEDVVSLNGDTNVNNNLNKGGKKKGTSNSRKNINALENDATDNEERAYGPKNDVEIVQITATTHPAILRIVQEDAKTSSVNTESITRKSELEFTIDSTKDSQDSESTEKETSPIPKGRTISLSSLNDFYKTNSFNGTKALSSLEDQKPYPYSKVSTEKQLIRKIEDATEEASAYENTIGRRESEDNKLFVITEPSTSFEKTVSRLKPTNPKRSGLESASSISPSTLTATPDLVSTLTTSNIETNDVTLNVTTIATIIVSKNGEGRTFSKYHTEIKSPELPSMKSLNNSTTNSILESSSTGIDDQNSKVMKDELDSTLSSTAFLPSSSPTKNSEMISSSSDENEKSTQTMLDSSTTENDNTSSSSLGMIKTTGPTSTANVEYEFVGLTESTTKGTSNEETSLDSKDTTNYEEMLTDLSTAGINLRTVDNPTTTADLNESQSTVASISSNTAEITETYENANSHAGMTSRVDVTSDEMTEFSVLPTTIDEITSISHSKNIMISSTTDFSSNSTSDIEFSKLETAQDAASGEVTYVLTTDSAEASITTTLKSMSTTDFFNPFTTASPPPNNVVIPTLPRVKVVIDASLSEVCSSIHILQQALAELLTANSNKNVSAEQIVLDQSQCDKVSVPSMSLSDGSLITILLYIIDENGALDESLTEILPSLYKKNPDISYSLPIRSFHLITFPKTDSGNAIAVVAVSCVAFICLVLLAGLLFIMRKRQTRFNYGERCRPVSLDAYSLDSVSAYNSVRRKGVNRSSKRSYGNPSFEDSSAIPSHPLNFAGLSSFYEDHNTIAEEFTGIPQVSVKIDELPPGAEVKNRYANVIPLPETRVPLQKFNNDPLTEYINASYVRGPKNATKYYIACQAPTESTVVDFWRMIWEQQSKVIIMLTDLVENGVEKCTEYIPPSEVTDCHRLYGDYQITLKKRETKEKYAISTLILKNLENNTFREISHIWYLWPMNGVPNDGAAVIAILLEARALQRGGPGPIVVHCSPGTGRTGTLIALDLGIRQYEITRTVDVPRVVYTIRRDRAGAVQTKEQYAFIYKALNLYATKLAGGTLEST